MKKQKTEEIEGEEVKLDDDFQISLPVELILEFLSRLPIKPLTILSCTNKYLYNTINLQNQQFTKSHFTNYSQKNPILVFYTNYEIFLQFPHAVQGGYKLISSGFGFDSINNEFKRLIIVLMFETKYPKCLLFTFGIKSSWTQVRSPNSGLLQTSTSAIFASYGAAAAGGGGALFWWTTDPQVILLFDLHEDKLQYIRIPVERIADTRMFEYKGFLVVHLKILKAYKDDQAWDKETIDISTYSIPFSDNLGFVSFTDNILLYWADPKSFQFFNLHRKCLKVVRNIGSGMNKKRLPHENICYLKTLLPVRAQKSDRAALTSMMVGSFKNIWSLRQPKTVRGFFYSYYQSKTSEYNFFLDELVDLLDGSNPTAQPETQEPQQYHQQEQKQQNRFTDFQYLADMRAAISAGQQALSESSRHFDEAEKALSESTRHFNETEKALSESARHFNEAENAVNHLELHIDRLFPDSSE
ncbi:hypothetical protein MKW98_020839 [Papaver atlanticum]|uniref:F-box domain-containing protein n=1 Tax=Papaver atlanticum TaxID=357466 RepID=A0AAD4TIE9_9MAGN|nr:hypothetical protein MKW98_020839 [Papaver atlanticum]